VGVENVGDRAGGGASVGQGPWIGLVLEWAIAVELEFGQDAIGWRRGVRRLARGIMIGNH
jgi:hypothetical protein